MDAGRLPGLVQSRPAALSLTGILIGSFTTSPDFAPVPSGEMAFALTLFIEAANQRVPLPQPLLEASSKNGNEVCRELYRVLVADVGDEPRAERPQSGQHTTLYAAFHAVCNHYAGDPLQAAVCARVLAFYFLMERSAGAALADWVEEDPDTPEIVSLDPAVVAAVATVRLQGSVLLVESRFLEFVTETATAIRKQQPH